MNTLKLYWQKLLDLFSDQENPDEPIYDPVHIAALIVIVIFSVGVLFWLFWTLLVFGGGFFKKIVPAFKVLFTDRTLQDYGWVGYPYELGIFDGFMSNSVALVLTIALIIGIWWILEKRGNPSGT